MWNDWIPVIVAFLAGILSFLPVWWKSRKEEPKSTADTAVALTEGAGELVEKYEKLLDRLEKKVLEQDLKIRAQRDELDKLARRVRVLEGQIREMGATPRNGNGG